MICRVRGRTVEVLLNDWIAANDWPIARDVIDFLGLELPDPDDDSDAVGDLALLVDQGLTEFDLEAIATNFDEDSDVLVRDIAHKMKFGPQFDRAISVAD